MSAAVHPCNGAVVDTIRGTEEAGDKTLDRYIVDYLLRTGHMKTATALATKQDIEVGHIRPVCLIRSNSTRRARWTSSFSRN